MPGARLLVCLFGLALAAGAQQSGVDALAAGKFLVAEEQVLDPNFARTVVLLIDYGPEGAMGLIINRPATVTLAEVLPTVESLEGRTDRIYFGGPVQQDGLLILVRAEEPPEELEPIFGDVYAGGSARTLASLIVAGFDEKRLRGYAGYAGWGPGQLDGEVARGDWMILPAASSLVFDPAPTSIWKKLIDGRRQRFAELVSRLPGPAKPRLVQ